MIALSIAVRTGASSMISCTERHRNRRCMHWVALPPRLRHRLLSDVSLDGVRDTPKVFDVTVRPLHDAVRPEGPLVFEKRLLLLYETARHRVSLDIPLDVAARVSRLGGKTQPDEYCT